MDEGYLHLSCLHDGPIDTAGIESMSDDVPVDAPPHPWSDETLRELGPKIRHSGSGTAGQKREFMREMIERYGTCAILAWEGREVVGHLRFLPMRVARLIGQTEPCPVLDAMKACEPEEDEGTLWVQCVMTSRPYASSERIVGGKGPASRTMLEAGARRGRGLKLARALISWAREHGWKRIVKVAHCDLDCMYGVVGGGGKAFWEKAGFRVVRTYYDEAPKEMVDWRAAVESQARAKGISRQEAWTWYRMGYDLQQQ